MLNAVTNIVRPIVVGKWLNLDVRCAACGKVPSNASNIQWIKNPLEYDWQRYCDGKTSGDPQNLEPAGH